MCVGGGGEGGRQIDTETDRQRQILGDRRTDRERNRHKQTNRVMVEVNPALSRSLTSDL